MIDILSDYGVLLLIGTYPNGPIGGLVATLILSLAGIALAFPISIVLALAQLSEYRCLRYPALFLRYFLRSIPLVMLIFGVYFILPRVIDYSFSEFSVMLITLILFQAVYLAEIVRAGIDALPKGQSEAAKALGMGYWTRTFKIVLPQALTHMLPSMVSQFVTTIKDTSLGYVIGVNELTYAANQVNTSLIVRPFEVFFLLSIMYFLLCFTLTQGARLLEKRLQKESHPTVNHTPLNPVSTSR